jgi:hypothetical protein
VCVREVSLETSLVGGMCVGGTLVMLDLVTIRLTSIIAMQ